MHLNELLREVHHRIEAKERARITQITMANRLGISVRTYMEYLRGTNSPLSMKVMLTLLSQLSDEEMVAVVREWSLQQEVNRSTNENA